SGQARTDSLAAPGELPSRRRTAGGGARRATANDTLLRVPPRELVRPRGRGDPALTPSGSRHRRRPEATLPDARADRTVDVRPLPSWTRKGWELHADAASGVGRSRPRVAQKGRCLRVLQRRLGRARNPRGGQAP